MEGGVGDPTTLQPASEARSWGRVKIGPWRDLEGGAGRRGRCKPQQPRPTQDPSQASTQACASNCATHELGRNPLATLRRYSTVATAGIGGEGSRSSTGGRDLE